MVVDPLPLKDSRVAANGTRTRAAGGRNRSPAAESDPVLSARHRALATVSADADVATAVAAAAQLAFERGAVREAEELSAHALRLTPAGAPEELDRLLDLARCHLSAGDLASAASLLRGRVSQLPPGRPRALGYLLLGEASDGTTEEQELDRAIAEVGDDFELYGMALCRKAVLLATHRVQRLFEAEALAREAQSYIEGTAEEGRGRLALAWSLVLRGQPVDELRDGGSSARPGVETSIDRPASIRRAFRGEVDQAIEMMLRLAAQAEACGDVRSRLGMSIQLCEFALRQGDLAGAQAPLDHAEQWVGIDEMSLVCARLKAVMAAVRGQPRQVREWADIVLSEVTSPHRTTWEYLEARRALGLGALQEGDNPAAVKHLLAVWHHCRKEGVDDPGAFPVAGDLVEALVECRGFERAGEVTHVLAQLSDDQDHPWGQATTTRCRAVLAWAQGDRDGAGEALLAAAGDYRALGLEFEQARTLLYLGRLRPRSEAGGRAGAALEDAIEIFERLGCDGWASVGRNELLVPE